MPAVDIKIHYTEPTTTPQEWLDDRVYIGRLYFFHKKYELGNTNPYESQDDLEASAEYINGRHVSIYMLDHSTLHFSITPFANKWDSGKIGEFVCSLDELNLITAVQPLECYLTKILDEYSSVVNGDRYDISIELNDEPVGSVSDVLVDDSFEQFTQTHIKEIMQHVE